MFEYRFEGAWPAIAENWIFAETRFKLLSDVSRGFAKLAAARTWWKYPHSMATISNSTNCRSTTLSKDGYEATEW